MQGWTKRGRNSNLCLAPRSAVCSAGAALEVVLVDGGVDVAFVLQRLHSLPHLQREGPSRYIDRALQGGGKT